VEFTFADAIIETTASMIKTKYNNVDIPNSSPFIKNTIMQ
jgi:hypothetical protein